MESAQPKLEQDDRVRSGDKTGHMTAPTQRIELITRGERRRRWSIEEKRAIVAESLEPGIRPAEIIRRYGITSGQLYSWRHQLTRRLDRQPPAPAASFARVDVWSAEPRVQEALDAEPPTVPTAKVPAIAEPRGRGLIEIALPCGTTVRVDARVDDRALRRVLDALRAR
jgi:transposase